MVFSTTDLDALIEKEKNIREKEEGKYFRYKLESPTLYGKIALAMTSKISDNKIRMI